jgi:hypothetical protein
MKNIFILIFIFCNLYISANNFIGIFDNTLSRHAGCIDICNISGVPELVLRNQDDCWRNANRQTCLNNCNTSSCRNYCNSYNVRTNIRQFNAIIAYCNSSSQCASTNGWTYRRTGFVQWPGTAAPCFQHYFERVWDLRCYQQWIYFDIGSAGDIPSRKSSLICTQ